jgi:branched-chain amino acid transport system ATP-binding protein
MKLEVNDLHVSYDSAPALFGVSLSCSDAETVAIIGQNGAGKTTLLRAISGFMPGETGRVTNGTVRLDGVRIDRDEPSQNARRGLALVAERNKVFPGLSVLDNMRVVRSRLKKAEVNNRIGEMFELFPSLKARERSSAGKLSGGERQMLAIARALLTGPRLLMVDELSFGLAPKTVDDVARALRSAQRSEGFGILLVEQSASTASALADRVYVLRNGLITHQGPAAGLLTDESALLTAYLGG